LGAGTKNLLYATAFLFLAGAVTGSVFKTRTLLLVLFLGLGEAGLLAIADIRFAAIWAIVSLTAIQVGYLSGVLTREILAQAGFSIPPADVRWPN
jgi:hypothetical protein